MKIKPANIKSLFPSPLLKVQLDLDLEKITEFAFQMRDQDNKGNQKSNVRGWQSNNIYEEKHEEFEKLKKEINQYLLKYRSEIFHGVEFKENVTLRVNNIWININGKYHYNDWHTHPMSTLSGVFYIKHDGSKEHGVILFKNPTLLNYLHFSPDIIKIYNQVVAEQISIKPVSNTLLIFPSWLEHRVEDNLKDDVRISLSFNAWFVNSNIYYHDDQFEPDNEKENGTKENKTYKENT